MPVSPFSHSLSLASLVHSNGLFLCGTPCGAETSEDGIKVG